MDRRGFLKGAVLLGTGVALGGVEVGLANPADALAVPNIASVNAWGAAAARGAIVVLNQRPNKILIHHTDTPNTSDTSTEHAYGLARSIQQSHFNNGWYDTGQHFTISRGGHAMQGRHNSLGALRSGTKQVVGSHCPGQNDISIGIENEGNYTANTPPAALYDKLVIMCAYICDQYDIPSTQLFGHRDYFATDCPGNVLYSKLPQLRDDVHDLRVSD